MPNISHLTCRNSGSLSFSSRISIVSVANPVSCRIVPLSEALTTTCRICQTTLSHCGMYYFNAWLHYMPLVGSYWYVTIAYRVFPLGFIVQCSCNSNYTSCWTNCEGHCCIIERIDNVSIQPYVSIHCCDSENFCCYSCALKVCVTTKGVICRWITGASKNKPHWCLQQ